MSNNPYYTGDEDDDIFENTKSNSSVNRNGQIPEYLQEALNKYIYDTQYSGNLSDFFSSTINNLSIESFALESLNAILNSQLFIWVEDKEAVLFPFVLGAHTVESSSHFEMIKADFLQSLIEKTFALAQIDWMVSSKFDYMTNSVLDFIHSKPQNEEYKNYNINYMKIVNNYIKNMVSLYVEKFYETVNSIFDNDTFQKYSPVQDNIHLLKSMLFLEQENGTYNQQEFVEKCQEINKLINDSLNLVEQIRETSIAVKV